MDLNRSRMATLWLVAVVTPLWACSRFPGTLPSDPPPPEELVRPGDTVETPLAGRPFQLTALAATIRGQEMFALEILGDDVMVSFNAQAPPHVPVVSGDVVTFGGHTFEVTSTPNAYIVDGRLHRLEPGGIYQFQEGQFVGSFD